MSLTLMKRPIWPGPGLFVESLMSAIAQGDEAAKQRVRDFLGKRAGKVGKAS